MTGIDDHPAPRLWDAMSLAHRSIFRLETLQSYNEPEERHAFAEFLADGRLPQTAPSDPVAEPHPYMVELQSALTRGCSFGRVHVTVEPLSDYMRFELAAYEPNVLAGDDVRIWAVGPGRPTRRWPEGIPRQDFWLIDSKVLLNMVYDDHHTWIGLTQVTDPARIRAACEVRDTAWRHAVRWTDYITDRAELYAS